MKQTLLSIMHKSLKELEKNILADFDEKFRITDFDFSQNSEFIKAFLSSTIHEVAQAVAEAAKIETLPPTHADDCIYMRQGCDCGLMEKMAYNQALFKVEQQVTDFMK